MIEMLFHQTSLLDKYKGGYGYINPKHEITISLDVYLRATCEKILTNLLYASYS